MIEKARNYFYTVIQLKNIQIFGRIFYHLRKPKVKLYRNAEVELPKTEMMFPLFERASMLDKETFRFLNLEGKPFKNGGWNSPKYSQLWIYNLHYFNDLVSDGFIFRKTWHLNLIEHWIDENPQGMSNGWLSYPLSLRIVNWIKWHLMTSGLTTKALASLYEQIYYQSKRIEYHLQGNHLFVNGKALLIGGLFFNDQKIFNLGMDIISKEIPEQVNPDGSNYELSPMYHAIMLEDILDMIYFLKNYGREIPSNWESTVTKMLYFLKASIHPDGGLSFFNDSVDGISKGPYQLIKYARNLGIEFSWPQKKIAEFKDAGLVRASKGEYCLLFDGGPTGPKHIMSHVHADNLSFELSYREKRLIVNSGISGYAQEAKRNDQRHSSAHNTITIDDQSSSEVWSIFRVARRANPLFLNVIEQDDFISIRGAHDGFTRLKGAPVHKREVKLLEKSIVVTDDIAGGGYHQVKSYLHFHPDYDIVVEQRDVFICSEGVKLVRILTSGGEQSIGHGQFYPEFGIIKANKNFILTYTGNLPVILTMTLEFL